MKRTFRQWKNKALYIKALGEIYTHLEDEMNWNCMKYHDPDDYHAKAWFTVLDEEDSTDYIKAQYKAYKKVLYQIEALVADV